MKQPIQMYIHLRKYLSPIISYDLVKQQFPKLNMGLIDLEFSMLKKRF